MAAVDSSLSGPFDVVYILLVGAYNALKIVNNSLKNEEVVF